jgi:hypothetical protein
MPSSGMLHCVALATTDVSVERIASNIRETRIGELGRTSAVISNRTTLRRILEEPHGVTYEKTAFFYMKRVHGRTLLYSVSVTQPECTEVPTFYHFSLMYYINYLHLLYRSFL